MINLRKLFSILPSRKDQPGIISKDLIRKFLPRNPVIVEAGAHKGWDTIEISRLWPHAMIHCFEPVPELYDLLVKNTSCCKNVFCYPLALSDITGNRKMFISSGASDASSSLMQPEEHLSVHPDVLFEKDIMIKTITLDDWAMERGIERVDFLWLDMQGHELAVMKASKKTFQTARVIQTEVSLLEVYKGAPLYPEVRQWLQRQGFYIEREELPWKDMGNVLFIKGVNGS